MSSGNNYQLMSTKELEEVEVTGREKLAKIGKYITAFMYECQCIEERISTTQNTKLRKILEQKM
jgi:hypothetical protein